MFVSRMYKMIVAVVGLSFIVSACGASEQEQAAIISTAVAQTVEAENAVVPLTEIPTLTPAPALSEATPAAAFTPTSEATLSSAPPDADCIHADLVGESPPDGTVYKPGTGFTKTWTIRNVGTCTWDTTYKVLFWSGDEMGNATYYNLPELVPPGDDVSINIPLKAPDIEGLYTSYWRLQTPWNAVFGVGQYSQAFYAQILVDKKPSQEYAVIDVTYSVLRTPAEGCPTNVLYTVYATITTNGPMEITYQWLQKDGNESAKKKLNFKEAGSKTISREWMIGRGDSQTDRWMQIIVFVPERIDFSQAVFPNNCP